MAEVVKTTFRLRRGDIKTWEENNPVLKKGEPGVAYENGRVKCLKIGDGISPWNKLEAIGAGETSVSGVSSVNGQQGIVQITPENIGAPTKEELEKLDRELQERLEEVEQKDVTEDYENSDFYDSSKAIQFLLTFSKPGKYCLHDGTMRIYQCEIIEIGGALYHNIKEYTDDLGVTIYYYRNSNLTCYIEFASGHCFISQMVVGTPIDKFEVANKSYVDDAIANALTTIDNAETLSF